MNDDVAKYLATVRSLFENDWETPTSITQRPSFEAEYLEAAVVGVPYWEMPDDTLEQSAIVSAFVGMESKVFKRYIPGLCLLAAEDEANMSTVMDLFTLYKRNALDKSQILALKEFFECLRDYSYLEVPRRREYDWDQCERMIQQFQCDLDTR